MLILDFVGVIIIIIIIIIMKTRVQPLVTHGLPTSVRPLIIIVCACSYFFEFIDICVFEI